MSTASAPRSSVAALVLAAGESSRMGAAKLALPLAGRPLLRHALDAVLASRADPVLVVTGAHADVLRPIFAETAAREVLHEGWAEGLASSIRAGLEAAWSARPGLSGVLIVLGDQPGVDGARMDRLIGGLEQGHARVASAYRDVLGPPAAFARSEFAALRALDGDRGARALLPSDDPDVARIEFAAGAHDVDTPDDLEFWRKRAR